MMSWTWNSSRQRSFCAGDDRLRHRGDGVGIALTALGLAEGANRGVHLVHELVEVEAALLLRGYGGEEEVHQHGFAAADFADEVGAANGVFPRKDATAWLGDGDGDAVEHGGGAGLVGVGRQGAALDAVVEGGGDGGISGLHGASDTHRVIPAKAGIQPGCDRHPLWLWKASGMDSRFRGNDIVGGRVWTTSLSSSSRCPGRRRGCR